MDVANAVLLAQQGDPGGAIAGVMVAVFYLAVIGLMIASCWVIFEKAGEPGWAAIIPIYNAMVLCRVAGKPEWWVVLMLIPCVNIVILILVYIGLAEKFGAGGGFAVGLILLGIVFFPILAFGSYEYEGRRKKKKKLRRDYDDDEDDDYYEKRKPKRIRDEDDDDRPRRRRRDDDDDDEDDRPRRRRRRDDDDDDY